MHYYQHHIGDFIKDTAFLQNDEVGIYIKLLWLYYDTEKPLPDNLFELSMKTNTRDNQAALQGILEMFFDKQDGHWHHARCDREIAHYRQQIETASKAGKASAAKRAANKMSSDDEQEFNDRSTTVQPTNNQQPITNNQIKEAKASLSGTKFPDCPQQEILDLWKKHLPHLTQPRVWEGTRRATLKARWVQASKPSEYSPEGYKTRQDGLAWWDELLGYIAKETRLAGGFETNGRVWKPDLEWVINATNFQKIIDGKYTK